MRPNRNRPKVSEPLPLTVGGKGTAKQVHSSAAISSTTKVNGKSAPSPRDLGQWFIYYFQRHCDDDPSCAVPGREFLTSCPTKVQATMKAVLVAVAAAPPPAFSGGGKWEAMHGEMGGFYEVRVDGPQRRHFRLFCMLERHGASVGLDGPSIVIITGKSKTFLTELSDGDYKKVRALGDEFRRRVPRSVERG